MKFNDNNRTLQYKTLIATFSKHRKICNVIVLMTIKQTPNTRTKNHYMSHEHRMRWNIDNIKPILKFESCIP